MNASQALQQTSHEIGVAIAPKAITHLKSDKVRQIYRAGVNISHIRSPIHQLFMHLEIDLGKLPVVNPLVDEQVTLSMLLNIADEKSAESGEKVSDSLSNLPEKLFRRIQNEAARQIGSALGELKSRIDAVRKGGTWSEDDEAEILAAIGLAGRLPAAWRALAVRLKDHRFVIEDCLELWLRLTFATFSLLKALNLNELDEELIDAWDHELAARFPELVPDLEPITSWQWT